MQVTSYFRLTIFAVTVLLLVGIIVWRVTGSRQEEQLPDTPLVAFSDRPSRAPLRLLLKQNAGQSDNQTGAIPTYVCQETRCQAASNGPSDADAVSDGLWWYYYTVGDNDKIFFQRTNSETNDTQTIMESTPLTSPRGLYMSPNGLHVAFWLDNIDQPAKKLTELWVYDVADGGIRLIAESLYRPDIRSAPRWNTFANYLMMIADTGEKNSPDRLELLLVNVDSPGKQAVFGDVDWQRLQAKFVTTPIDLSIHSDRLVYTNQTVLGQPQLLTQLGNASQRTTTRGEVKYVQWLEDDSLLYALQDERGFTFWRMSDGVHRFIARRPGQLTSALSDVGGEHVAFVVISQSRQVVYSMHITSGLVSKEGTIAASFPVEIAHVQQLPPAPEDQTADIAGQLDDAEIAAVIERSFDTIVDSKSAQPLRLIMTDQLNTVYLDYRDNSQEARILLKIHDAINTEWSIKARYEPINREWTKVMGGGLSDPKVTRLYEWENSLNQWVLKENL